MTKNWVVWKLTETDMKNSFVAREDFNKLSVEQKSKIAKNMANWLKEQLSEDKLDWQSQLDTEVFEAVQ